MLDIHTVVPFRMCRAVAPHMREPAKIEREEGREVFRKIVNVSSISGTMGNAGQANYSSGKWAVIGLTKTLAKEWGQFKINVNAVAFGFIETRLTAAKNEENVAEIRGEMVQLGIPEQLRAMGPALIPLGRAGTPREAAGGVFLLCTPWANYINGQVLSHHGRSVRRDDLVSPAFPSRTSGRAQVPEDGEHAPVSSSPAGRSSLAKMFETCFSTAPRVTTISRAIAVLVRPWATTRGLELTRGQRSSSVPSPLRSRAAISARPPRGRARSRRRPRARPRRRTSGPRRRAP